ncbi:MAG: 6-bladed beta-propeller [Longimicrobiales bacterium]
MVHHGQQVPPLARGAITCLTAGFWVLLAGCTGEAAGPRVALSDSAGVRIVVSQRPRLAGVASWTVSEAPVLAIGAEEGDPAQILFGVRGTVRLSDGRIVVANQGTNELRYFDGTGTHLLSSGRTGSGPGEFQFLDAIWPGRSDTVFAADRANNRITVFDASGALARSFDVEPGPGISRPFKQGMLADGTILASSVQRSGQRNRQGVTRDSVAYLRYTPHGQFDGIVATVPFLELFATAVDGELVFDAVPFSQPAVVAVGRDRIFVAPEKAFELRGYGPGGTLEVLIRRSHDPVQVDRSQREAYRTQALRDVTDPVERRQLERLLDEVPYGAHQPAIASALVDDDGYLWVETFRFPAPAVSRWSVFSSDGSWETDVRLPKDFTPYQIGREFLLGVQTDALDSEQVVLYGLVRDGSGSPEAQDPAS